MSRADLLIELGTEELPPRALSALSAAFTQSIVDGLDQHGLEPATVEAYATPRRLAVIVKGVLAEGESRQIELLGPPADRAKEEDGSWTKAAQGFARKNNIDPDELQTVESEKGPRLAVRAIKAGHVLDEVLQTIVSATISDLPIPKRMRWGDSRTEFVRPVHWAVVLHGDRLIKIDILGLTSQRKSRGHRFHSSGWISIESADDYAATLLSEKVVASFAHRRDQVRTQVEAQARLLNAEAVIDPDLLDEVTALVEWPVALAGSFEQRFVDVPAEALISSMKEHQKYFHLVDANGTLVPHFITVANIESRDPAQVIDGNERVIRPRLADADFFFRTDLKTPLAQRIDALGSIVFQKKLGTVLDKTERISALARSLAAGVGADPEHTERAARLCKTDLVTDMVSEFSDMQGIAGRYYALHDQEHADVAAAIEQHYWPKFSGDQLPAGPVATAVALADRLDTLVGIFGIKQAPTGSKDPFALRRASLAVLRILVIGEHTLDLKACLQQAVEAYPQGTLVETTAEDVFDYMLERFRAWYEEESIPAEVFRAVSARPVTQPLDIHRRVHAVSAFSQLPQASSLAAANRRVSNLLEKENLAADKKAVSEDLLTENAEKQLYAEVSRQKTVTESLLNGGDYRAALASLAELQEPVDGFFDNVMVMAENPKLRENRIALLQSLQNLFLQVADISQLVISKTN